MDRIGQEGMGTEKGRLALYPERAILHRLYSERGKWIRYSSIAS